MRLLLTALAALSFLGLANAQEMAPGKPGAAEAKPQPAAAAAKPAPGLKLGERAPAFEGRDQFGHAVSNETLRGARGTIVLFFRSADW